MLLTEVDPNEYDYSTPAIHWNFAHPNVRTHTFIFWMLWDAKPNVYRNRTTTTLKHTHKTRWNSKPLSYYDSFRSEFRSTDNNRKLVYAYVTLSARTHTHSHTRRIWIRIVKGVFAPSLRTCRGARNAHTHGCVRREQLTVMVVCACECMMYIYNVAEHVHTIAERCTVCICVCTYLCVLCLIWFVCVLSNTRTYTIFVLSTAAGEDSSDDGSCGFLIADCVVYIVIESNTRGHNERVQ